MPSFSGTHICRDVEHVGWFEVILDVGISPFLQCRRQSRRYGLLTRWIKEFSHLGLHLEHLGHFLVLSRVAVTDPDAVAVTDAVIAAFILALFQLRDRISFT